MWTADNTINVIRLILLGGSVRKIQFFIFFFGKNFVNSMSERTRLSSLHSPGSESWGKSPYPQLGSIRSSGSQLNRVIALQSQN